MNESLRTIDGRPVLRIERRLAHPPQKVWRAITDPAHLSKWYPLQAAEIDLRVGGMIRFDDGQGMTMEAVITELDPPRVFAFSEHAPAEMVRESDDLVHFELRPDGAGCLLIFTHTFDDRPAAASYASGWHLCLDALGMLLDDKPIEVAHSSAELHETYVKAFGLTNGSVEATAEGWRVRFERQLMQQPIDKVWAALNASTPGRSTSEARAPRVGEPAPNAFTIIAVPSATITALEAPTLLEYDWLLEGRPAGRVRWVLSTGPGGARITLTQTGPRALADLQPTLLAAWEQHIEQFVEQLVSDSVSPPASLLGTLRPTEDGRTAVRFERSFAHPPEKVWRAITEPEHLRAWFPAVVEFELRRGARLRFGATPEQQRRFGIPEDHASYGEVTQVDPPSLLEYTWGEETLRWELRPDGDRGCRLVFTNILGTSNVSPELAAGWHAGLEVVEAQLDGREVSWSVWDRAEQLRDDYIRNFG